MAAKRGPNPRPGILDIAPYVPGTSALPGAGKAIKLSSNETPLGPSPRAIEAYLAEAAHLSRYPDGSARPLREALAQRYGLDAARIVCGAGSDELLNLLAAAYLGPGDEAIYSEHGFLVYKIAILAHGATPIVAPERDLTADVDAILARVSDATRMVFIANPNNPTGTYLSFDEVKRLHAGLPAHVILVLDAAYAEYVRANDYEAGIELVATSENTVMTRTFSKIYGLAALRLGWAYCPAPIADALNRIRGPFNVTGPSIAAGVESLIVHKCASGLSYHSPADCRCAAYAHQTSAGYAPANGRNSETTPPPACRCARAAPARAAASRSPGWSATGSRSRRRDPGNRQGRCRRRLGSPRALAPRKSSRRLG